MIAVNEEFSFSSSLTGGDWRSTEFIEDTAFPLWLGVEGIASSFLGEFLKTFRRKVADAKQTVLRIVRTTYKISFNQDQLKFKFGIFKIRNLEKETMISKSEDCLSATMSATTAGIFTFFFLNFFVDELGKEREKNQKQNKTKTKLATATSLRRESLFCKPVSVVG